jgi:hypothetical protein
VCGLKLLVYDAVSYLCMRQGASRRWWDLTRSSRSSSLRPQTLVAEGRIHAGSVKALVGSYSFAPLDGGKRTRVTYQLSLDPGFPIPGMIKRATTKLIVGTVR